MVGVGGLNRVFHSNKGLIYLHNYVYLWRFLLFSSKSDREESGDTNYIRQLFHLI